MTLRTTARCALALCLALAAGCVTVHEEPQPIRNERSYSAVTSHSDTFRPKPGETFTWFTDAVVTSDQASGARIPAHALQLLEETITNQLIENGFRIAQDPTAADFLVGAGVLEKDAEQSPAMLEFIHIFPAIRETLDADQPVSLLIAAGRKNALEHHHQMWRGAVNAAVVTADIPEAERAARLSEIVDSLLKRFP